MNSTSTEQKDETMVYAVVGATGGIGSEVCRRLSAKKARVVAASRDSEKLAVLGRSTDIFPLVLDATLSEEVQNCMNQAVERYGRIDGMVNCVGSLLLKPGHLTSDWVWEKTIVQN